MASHAEVAHRWAQDDPTVRPIKADRVWYERYRAYERLFAEGSEEQVIFSHRSSWPLAAFQTLPSGERVVLVNSQHYSVSTARHLSYVRGALGGDRGDEYSGWCERRDSHGHRILDVAHVSPRNAPSGAQGFHAGNLGYLMAKAADAYHSAQKRRSQARRDSDLSRANFWYQNARAYVDAFDMPADSIPPDVAAVAATIAAAERDRAAERERQHAETRRKRAEAEAYLRKENRPKFEAWIADASGSFVPAGYGEDETGAAYVRRHREGDELQTSMGARVPWREAVKVYRLVSRLRERHEGWVGALRVGAYVLTAVTPEGDITVGCHTIRWAAMHALALKEGVADAAL